MLCKPLIESPETLLDIPAAAALDEAARKAVSHVLRGPLEYSLVGRMEKSDHRKAMGKLLRSCGVAPDAIGLWCGGLLDAGVERVTLDALIASGWLDSCNHPTLGVFVTLSAWGAYVLGVTIHEYSDECDGAARWGLPDPRPRPIRIGGNFGRTTNGNPLALDEAADQSPGPVESAIIAEEFVMREVKTAEGKFEVDPATGRVRVDPVLLWGCKIPREKRRKRKAGKKASKRKSKAA